MTPTPYWADGIIDEEELSPEERAQLPWNDPADFERPYHFDDEESPLGLRIIIEDDWDDEGENGTTYAREEPDINLIYGYYEESEFY